MTKTHKKKIQFQTQQQDIQYLTTTTTKKAAQIPLNLQMIGQNSKKLKLIQFHKISTTKVLLTEQNTYIIMGLFAQKHYSCFMQYNKENDR